jgi:hypothetical protein
MDKPDSTAIMSTSTPLNYLLWSMDKATAEGKNVKLVVADVMANLYLSISMPNYSSPISIYWEFNSNLDSLINIVASSVRK